MNTTFPLQCREVDAHDDMEELTSLIRAAYAPHSAEGLRYWATHQTVEDTVKRFASGIGLVGEIDGRIVATILLRRPDPASKVEAFRDAGTWKFEQFAVSPEFKGRGIGRQLHEFALAHAYARGCRRMALDTAEPAQSLIAMYASWGYAVVGTCDWRPFTNYPSVVMAKVLTARSAPAGLPGKVPPSTLYHAVTGDLRAAYDGSAEVRAASEREPWKHAERQTFLTRLQAEGKKSLFEVGAGGGQDSQFFADHGLQVVATDLSPRMVEMCRRRGLDARVMDVVDLQLPPKAFQACYSMNSLLHVPNADLENALLSIRGALEPGALCYVGVYGAEEPFEGILASDVHTPQRFFSFRTNEQLLAAVERLFHIEDFHVLDTGSPYQSLTLRVR